LTCEWPSSTSPARFVPPNLVQVATHAHATLSSHCAQKVITRDTVSIDIDGLLFYQITDPVLACFKIQNLPDALELLTQSTLRNLMAHITLDETFSSRDQINAALMHALHEDCERWGVTITRVEIQNIIPPHEISRAMETMITEERARASKVLRADGDKQSKIIISAGMATKLVLDAEGTKQAEILKARGSAQSREVVADAEAKAIVSLRSELGESNVKAANYFTGIQSLNALRAMSAGAKPDVTLVPAAAIDMASQIMGRTKTA
jgi:regulator of protease activity HflC (stomatin/prohibitin superfamily)